MDLSTDILELRLLITQLLEELSVAKSEISLLKSENLDLKRQLGQNSENSHKPPSTDFHKVKKARSLREKTDKKVGGQKGHDGHHLKMVEKADEIIVHSAVCCSCCGKIFDESSFVEIVDKRQVFDIPSPKLFVTEHQIAVHQCCKKTHIGEFPQAVKSKTQYGINLQTFCSVLTTECRLSYQKASDLLSDMFDCSLSVGTVLKANQKLYETLESVEAEIKAAILGSSVAHFDETGVKVEKKNYWVHVSCTDLYTYLFAHEKRGLEGLASNASILKDFSAWAVHDCWKSYFHFEACKHVLCNAHILRELNALIEEGSIWAKKMHKLLMDMYQKSEKGSQTLENLPYFLQLYDYICKIGEKEEPIAQKSKNGRLKSSKGRNLLNRLKHYQREVTAFALHQIVPFTNNEAERAIRHVKIKQKISMCFRTFDGVKIYLRIQGVIDTIKKHGLNVFQTIKSFNLNQKVAFNQKG